MDTSEQMLRLLERQDARDERFTAFLLRGEERDRQFQVLYHSLRDEFRSFREEFTSLRKDVSSLQEQFRTSREEFRAFKEETRGNFQQARQEFSAFKEETRGREKWMRVAAEEMDARLHARFDKLEGQVKLLAEQKADLSRVVAIEQHLGLV
jgi:hypothetical protein